MIASLCRCEAGIYLLATGFDADWFRSVWELDQNVHLRFDDECGNGGLASYSCCDAISDDSVDMDFSRINSTFDVLNEIRVRILF